MDRSIFVTVFALALASSVMAEDIQVHVIKNGQFYHRQQCLVVDEHKAITVQDALGNGFTPCPDCSPPRMVDHVIRDDGPTPYYKTTLAYRGAGVVYNGEIKGRVQTLKERDARAAAIAANPALAQAPAPAQPALGTPGGAAAPAVQQGTPPALAQAAAAARGFQESGDAAVVGGTGGLLRAATFSPTPMQQAMTYYGQPIAQPNQPSQ